MTIKFTGKWTDLKPLGYKFQRLFANNYICYHQEELWIWKKGQELEIADCYDDSCLILKYLIDNNFKLPKFNTFVTHRIEKTCEEVNFRKHSFTSILLDLKSKGQTLTDEEMENMSEEHSKKYKETTLSEKTMLLLKELYEKNMIQIV